MGRKRRATARKGKNPKSSRGPSPDQAAGIAERLSSALGCHRSGDLEQAEILYRQVLARLPEHPDALHLFGVLAHQTGRLEEAGKTVTMPAEALGRQEVIFVIEANNPEDKIQLPLDSITVKVTVEPAD